MTANGRDLLTIGRLAKRAGMRTSALRFYEEQGLLTPDERSDAGYRLYRPKAVERLRFIQRAQRLGFSLEDIGVLLQGETAGATAVDADTVTATAEARYLALEEEITRLLVLRHELQSFLHDLYRQLDTTTAVDLGRLLLPAADNPLRHADHADTADMFTWMLERLDCKLTTEAGQAILQQLQGQHVHIWREGEDYHVLVVSEDPAVAPALQALAELEEQCTAHPQTVYHVTPDHEGFLLTATGPRAFLFARLFLALEAGSSSPA